MGSYGVKYRTAHGSTVSVGGKRKGEATVEFDWFEEDHACIDCQVDPYPNDAGDGTYRLVWYCDECGGGSAQLFADEN